MAGTYLDVPPPGGGSGTITGGQNLGTGDGVFSGAVGTNLQFKSLVAGTNITLTPSATEILIDATGGGGGGLITSISDTNSIDLTETAGDLTADVKLSAAAATAGSFKATTTIKVDGLHVEAPIATTSLTGFISDTDWDTFNNKEPAITATSAADYYRGDKSFQPLNVPALTAIVDGSSAALGDIGEILTASQATNTSTGVGATGAFGAITSLLVSAGVWELSGTAAFSENAAVLTTALEAAISASATGVGIGDFDRAVLPNLISSTSDALTAVPTTVVSVAAPTTYYLNSKFYYTAGTPQHRGRIVARRIR